MRYARLLTVSQYALRRGVSTLWVSARGCLPKGDVCLGVSAQGAVCLGVSTWGRLPGGCLSRGCLYRGCLSLVPGVSCMQWGRHPPVDRQTPVKT